MQFKKRQFMLLGLVVLVCVASFLNWRYNKQPSDLETTDTLQMGKTLGEARLVSGEVQEETSGAVKISSNYFDEARITRQQTRDESVELLKSQLNNPNSDEAAKKKANEQLSIIAANIEKEGKIENLVKAKGFEDCIAIISDSNVTVIVKTNGLLPNEASQIKDIVKNETGVTTDKIRIVEVK